VVEEIAAWIKDQKIITSEKFEAYLREIYNRRELRERFPNGF